MRCEDTSKYKTTNQNTKTHFPQLSHFCDGTPLKHWPRESPLAPVIAYFHLLFCPMETITPCDLTTGREWVKLGDKPFINGIFPRLFELFVINLDSRRLLRHLYDPQLPPVESRQAGHWREDTGGRAIKSLDPHLASPPSFSAVQGFISCFIWIYIFCEGAWNMS